MDTLMLGFAGHLSLHQRLELLSEFTIVLCASCLQETHCSDHDQQESWHWLVHAIDDKQWIHTPPQAH